MKIFLTKPRLQYFLLSSLTLPLFGGVASQTVVMDEYAGPNPVVENTRINFTGTATSTTGSYPTGISFFIIRTKEQSDARVCNMDFSICDSTLDASCYCSNITGNIYYFVIQIYATLERNNATIRDDLDTTRVVFPLVIAQTTTRAPTTVTSTTITTTPAQTTTRAPTTGTTTTTETTPEDQPETTFQIIRSMIGFLLTILVSVVIFMFVASALAKERIHEKNQEAEGDEQTDQVEEDASRETGLAGDSVAHGYSRRSLSSPVDPPTFVSWSGHLG